MSKVAFESSPNLLKAVITKQAGDWRKGIKELVQNSIDAALNIGMEPKIEIKIEPVTNSDGTVMVGAGNILKYRDNAGGLGDTIEVVKRNFAVFGDSLKAGDDRFLGKFGMGRGQAISMIFDPEQDKLDGTIDVVSNGKQSFILSDFRVDTELGFDIRKTSNPEKRRGTMWRIRSNAGRFSEKSIVSYLEKEFILTFPLMVNGKPVQAKPEGKKMELADATVYVKDSGYGFDLYERGLFVNTRYIFSGFSGSIVTKKPLKLNFARNDVLEDARWKSIDKAIRKICLDWFASRTEKAEITDMKQDGLLSHLIDHPEDTSRFANLPCIPLANGKRTTLAAIQGRQVYEAPKGSRLADDLLQRGEIVIDKSKDSAFTIKMLLAKTMPIKSIDEIPEAQGQKLELATPEGDEYDVLEYMNRVWQQLGYPRKIQLGKTTLGFLAWTDGQTYINLTRNLLRSKMPMLDGQERWRFWVAMAPTLAHELAHDSSDGETDIHGPQFEENHIEILDEMLTKFSTFDFQTAPELGVKA